VSHFDQQAKSWDDPKKIEMMNKLAVECIRLLELDDEKLDILDFGCGTGLFGMEFLPYAKSLTGVDSSEGMLKLFNEKTRDYENVRSIRINLERDSLRRKYDLIISSMTFHHLERPGEMIDRFETMLKEGGRIAIVDLDREDGTFHPDNDGMGVVHLGFSETVVKLWGGEDGLRVTHQIIHKIAKHGQEYGVFLALLSLRASPKESAE
jgi:predicted TPR repeat methyltransferase